MKVLHFDPTSGASGDMVLGALADCGVDIVALSEKLTAILPFEFGLEADSVVRKGIAGTHVKVELHEHHPPHRGLKDLVDIVAAADLDDGIKRACEETFNLLARAEADVHGTTPDKIHFHEVGAGDTLVDVIGAHLGVKQLGIERITCSEVGLGSGTVKCAHGVLPVPAPATAEILKGVPVRRTGVDGELTTPTGAALLVSLVDEFCPAGAMSHERVGYGFGTRDTGPQPNALRAFVGQSELGPGEDEVVVLETTVDDMSGEEIGYVFDVLFKAGALDVTTLPVGMKKSRPGVRVTVVGSPDAERALAEVLLRETTTFGVRVRRERRVILERRIERVSTQWGEVGVKVGSLGSAVLQAAPEFEDCRRIAESAGVSLRAVQQAALAAFTVPERGETE